MIILTPISTFLIRKWIIESLIKRYSNNDIPPRKVGDIIIQNLIKLIIKDQIKVKEKILLKGFLEVHKKNCNDPKCPINLKHEEDLHFSYIGENSKDHLIIHHDQPWLIYIMVYIYSFYLERKPNAINLQIHMCDIIINYFRNSLLGYYSLKKIENLSLSFQQSFTIFYYLKESEANIIRIKRSYNEYSRKQIQDIGLKQIIKYERHINKLSKSIDDCSNSLTEFWDKLDSTFPDLNSIAMTGKKLCNQINDIKKFWDNIYHIFSSRPYLLRYYSLFVKYALFDEKLFQRLSNESESLLLKNKENFDELWRNIYNEDICNIRITKENSSFWKIIYCNSSVNKIFGYKENELVNNDIKVIMPSCIGQIHFQFIDNYINTGIANKIDNETSTYGINSKGFLIQVKMILKPFLNLSDSMQFFGFIRKGKMTGLILANELGKIEAFSESISDKLNITLDQINNNIVLVQYLFPKLFKTQKDSFGLYTSLYEMIQGNYILSLKKPNKLIDQIKTNSVDNCSVNIKQGIFSDKLLRSLKLFSKNQIDESISNLIIQNNYLKSIFDYSSLEFKKKCKFCIEKYHYFDRTVTLFILEDEEIGVSSRKNYEKIDYQGSKDEDRKFCPNLQTLTKEESIFFTNKFRQNRLETIGNIQRSISNQEYSIGNYRNLDKVEANEEKIESPNISISIKSSRENNQAESLGHFFNPLTSPYKEDTSQEEIALQNELRKILNPKHSKVPMVIKYIQIFGLIIFPIIVFLGIIDFFINYKNSENYLSLAEIVDYSFKRLICTQKIAYSSLSLSSVLYSGEISLENRNQDFSFVDGPINLKYVDFHLLNMKICAELFLNISNYYNQIVTSFKTEILFEYKDSNGFCKESLLTLNQAEVILASTIFRIKKESNFSLNDYNMFKINKNSMNGILKMEYWITQEIDNVFSEHKKSDQIFQFYLSLISIILFGFYFLLAIPIIYLQSKLIGFRLKIFLDIPTKIVKKNLMIYRNFYAQMHNFEMVSLASNAKQISEEINSKEDIIKEELEDNEDHEDSQENDIELDSEHKMLHKSENKEDNEKINEIRGRKKKYKEFKTKYFTFLIKIMGIFILLSLPFIASLVVESIFFGMKETIYTHILLIRNRYSHNIFSMIMLIKLLVEGVNSTIMNQKIVDLFPGLRYELLNNETMIAQSFSNSTKYLSEYYTNLFKTVYQMDICESQILLLHETIQCQTYQNGMMKNGLYFSNIYFIDLLYQYFNDYILTPSNNLNILNSENFCDIEYMDMNFFDEVYDKIKANATFEVVRISNLNNTIQFCLMLWIILSGIIAIISWLVYANLTAKDIAEKKDLISLIPPKVIHSIASLRMFVMQNI